MSSTILNKLYDICQKYYYSIKGLLIGIVAVIIVVSSIDGYLKKLIITDNIRYLSYLIPVLLYSLIWYRMNYSIPDFNDKNFSSIIIISFFTENEEQKGRFNTDVVEKVKTLISSNNLNNSIKIVVPKEYQIKIINKILTEYFVKKNKKYEKKYKKLANQSFAIYIWGNIFQRNDTKFKYFINSHILAKHSELTEDLRKQLSKEMSSLIPQINFPVEQEYKGFNITADMLYLAIRYLTGTILYLSFKGENVKIAYNIHNGLAEEFEEKNIPFYIEIKKQLKRIFSGELYYLSCESFNEEHNAKKALEYSNKSLTYLPDSYEMLLWNGYLKFEVNRNTGQALNMFDKAKKYAYNYLWAYNKAFILFYLRNFKDALIIHQSIENKTFEGEENAIKDCIEYDQKIYEQEPDKPQFLYVIGYLYYKKLSNPIMALEFFEKFLEEVQNKRNYGMLTKKARYYLGYINKNLNSSDINLNVSGGI